MKKTTTYSHKKVTLDVQPSEPISQEELNEKNAQFWKENQARLDKYMANPPDPITDPEGALWYAQQWAEIHKTPEQQTKELAAMRQQIADKKELIERAIEQGYSIKQSEHGSRPNSAKTYAREIAQHLLQQHPDKTKLKIWREISKDKSSPDILETAGGDIEYYRNGEELFFNMDGQEEQTITKKHFFNTYLVKKNKSK